MRGAFDPAIVAAVAEQRGVDVADVEALLDRHQRLVVDDETLTADALVYEWRTAFHEDPQVGTDDDAYYLDVRDHVWEDFAERLGLSDAETATLRAVHRRQVEAATGEDRSGAMVLVKD